MPHQYYEPEDLEDFEKIGEYAPDQAKHFFKYYGSAVDAATLSQRETSLIGLAVAATQHCPYCIDAYTNKCLSLGVSNDEMMEAIHVGASIVAGATLAHSTQMRKIIRNKEM